jgi:16S rRNA (guanine527-N7)-methyltransferase
MFSPDGGVSRETRDALEIYEATLLKWQKAVNLVGPGTLQDVWHRHFLDSTQLAPLIPTRPDGAPTVILDIGSGGGFPGLVLAVLAATGALRGPAITVHLVEANTRKCAFLKEVARITGAQAVIHRSRVENLPPFPVDVVMARAFAPLPRLLDLAARFLNQPDCHPLGLFLKGRGVDEELTEARKQWKMRVETIVSMTDPEGVVLRIEDIVLG